MKNKKLSLAIIAIVAFILVTIGITYAYWLVTKTQTSQNVLSTACLDITMTGEKNDITLISQYPLSDTDGKKLTPYEFTVTNKCSKALDYQVALELIGDQANAMKASSIKAALYNKNAAASNIKPVLLSTYKTATKTLNDAYESRRLIIDTLSAKGTKTYNLLLWIASSAPISENGKSFASKITVSAGQGIEKSTYEAGTLAYEIISSNGGEKNIKTIADFNTANQAGLYKAQDNYGTSYYFHGDVTNNYLKLEGQTMICPKGDCYNYGSYGNVDECQDDSINGGAPWEPEECVETTADSMYWRIVRINGDGTIKIIYDGTEAYENGVTHTASVDVSSVYWEMPPAEYASFEEREYEYMKSFGNSQPGSMWNDEFISNFSYIEDYLVPVKLCMDVTHSQVDELATSTVYYYAPSERLANKQPILTCPNEDYYATRDYDALLTIDEIIMAGSYLDIGEEFWTFSPQKQEVNSDDSYKLYMYTSNLNPVDYTNSDIGVRPVYNLKKGITFNGDGSKNNPYTLQ